MILARFPYDGDATKAGYVRYTDPDDTGATNYANQQWTADPTHPSQLWYDKDGNLMGADFSVPRPNGAPRPQVWGIDPKGPPDRQHALRPMDLERRFRERPAAACRNRRRMGSLKSVRCQLHHDDL
jgi:hypothetical protein